MTCESCGAEEDDLTAVHRKYVTAGDRDREPTERVVPEVERWCFPCLTQYPHEPTGA